MVADVQAAGARAVLVGLQVPPNYGPAYTRQFSQMFGKVAADTDSPLVPFLLEGFAGHAEQANVRVRRYGKTDVPYAMPAPVREKV